MVGILAANSAVSTGSYSIDNSLRFNDDDSAYLTRTPSSAGNRKTFTWSGWVKRSSVGSSGYLFTAKQDANNRFDFGWYTSGILLNFVQSGSTQLYVRPLALFRDPSAWYHLLFSIDTTNATASDRFKIYVNGVRVTDFVGGSEFENNFSQNDDTVVNTTNPHAIGANPDAGTPFDGYMADVHLIDGTAKAHTDFGEFDNDSGIWKPKAYSGSYGTNGFYLQFKQTGTSQNASGIGADTSGNGNHFAVNNLAASDVTTDTPTNNFSTLNPLRGGIGASSTIGALSEGNLKSVQANNLYRQSEGTIMPKAGKWYWETLILVGGGTDVGAIGIYTSGKAQGGYPGTTANGYGYDSYGSGSKIHNSTRDNSYGSSYAQGDIMGTALDLDNGTLTFYKNNSSQGQAYSGIDTRQGWGFGHGSYYGSTIVANFGQDGTFAGNKTAQGNADGNGFGDFYYSPPSGYLALCTQNLATELSLAIDDGSAHFHTQLYTGNGVSGRAITNDANAGDFKPDWLWIKHRNHSTAHSNNIYNSTGGIKKMLGSNLDEAYYVNDENVQAFNTDGFTVGTQPGTNSDGVNYKAWQWKANGGTTSSNSSGDITSTVQANTTAGFSIVTYTGTGSNATVGHGLGKVPAMMIVKGTSSGSKGWAVYHDGVLTASNARYHYVKFNSSGAYAGDGDYWNDTAPTTSVFTVGTSNQVNGSGESYIAFIFTEIEGYSRFHSYSGNGGSAGPFVYCGFKPAYLMIKRIESGGDGWAVFDSARDPYNGVQYYEFINNGGAEGSGTVRLDFLSNGFKLRQGSSSSSWNADNKNFLFMAFAANPFVSSSGVPVTAI